MGSYKMEIEKAGNDKGKMEDGFKILIGMFQNLPINPAVKSP